MAGASFITTTPPSGDSVELLFTIPTYAGPIITSAVVVARREFQLGTQVSVVFIDLDVEAELAIAQWFDEEMVLLPARSARPESSALSP